MTQINSSIPNLIGGVSQQPDLLRLPSHMQEQINGYSSPSSGLSKRPGTEYQGVAPLFAGGYYEMLDYGSYGLFWLHVENGNVKVFSSTGANVQLYDAAGNPVSDVWWPYLASPNAATSLRAVKEGDTTFLINTEVVAQKIAQAPSSSSYGALLWIKAGNYGKQYKVTVPGYPTAQYNTPDGSIAFHSYLADTGVIAENISNILAASGVNCSANGSVIYLPDAPAGITMEDGSGGNATGIVYRSVRSVSELPSSKVPNGFHVKLEGGDATAAGDYYLRFDAASNVWREVANPMESTYSLDPATLPHRLTPYGGGFIVNRLDWAGQLVGDSETNPGPSFVGRRINDLFFYQDRMGVLAGEGFDFSETGTYFNFYRTTVTTLLDSDPVAGTITSTSKLSTLHHAVAFGERLFLFSNTAQFELQSAEALTPKTGSAKRVTDFECSSSVRPTGIGSLLFFPVDRGQHTSFYNFFLDGIDSKAQAVDISGHAPEYIPKGVSKVAVSPVNNLLVALCDSEPNALYVYQFYTNGGERLQSSWHKWDFGTGTQLKGIGVQGTDLHIVLKRPTVNGMQAFVERLDMSAARDYRMDSRTRITSANLTPTAHGIYPKKTSFPIPYGGATGSYYAVAVTNGTVTKAGTIRRMTCEAGVATITGDFTGCDVVVGRQFDFSATLGTFYVREQAGAGSAGITRGRTQVTRAWVNYAEARTFYVKISRRGYPDSIERCNTRNLGTESATVGRDSLNAGRFKVPVMSQNTNAKLTLVNSSPLPSEFISLDWEGYHVSRGSHV